MPQLSAKAFNEKYRVPECTWLNRPRQYMQPEEEPTPQAQGEPRTSGGILITTDSTDEFEIGVNRMLPPANSDLTPEAIAARVDPFFKQRAFNMLELIVAGERAGFFGRFWDGWRCIEAYNNFSWINDCELQDIPKRLKARQVNWEWVRLF